MKLFLEDQFNFKRRKLKQRALPLIVLHVCKWAMTLKSLCLIKWNLTTAKNPDWLQIIIVLAI